MLPVERYSYLDGELRVPAGDAGSFILKFYDHVLDELGPDAESVITDSIRGSSRLEFPQLNIESPFRWMTPEDELPAHLEVSYETFVVRQGCEKQAVACNAFHGLQVIPMELVSEPARPFQGVVTMVSSPAPRPVGDPSYLDPGPLSIRESADVLWTGTEMVVWGGSSSGTGFLVDGAAYDPETNIWRMLDGPPLEAGTSSRAVWSGEAMVIVTPEATFVGDPTRGEWAATGLGYRLREDGSMVMIGDDLYVWALSGIAHMDADSQWRRLPEPGFGGSAPWHGLLLDFGGHLVATGSNCNGRRAAIWTGSEWNELQPVRFNDCSNANQTAVVGGELIMWSSDRDPTYRYSVTFLMWEDDEPVPSDLTESPSGGLIVDDRAVVPGFRDSAMYSSNTRDWTNVELPGFASDSQMVWTGTEVLAWTNGDAWRWTPPESG